MANRNSGGQDWDERNRGYGRESESKDRGGWSDRNYEQNRGPSSGGGEGYGMSGDRTSGGSGSGPASSNWNDEQRGSWGTNQGNQSYGSQGGGGWTGQGGGYNQGGGSWSNQGSQDRGGSYGNQGSGQYGGGSSGQGGSSSGQGYGGRSWSQGSQGGFGGGYSNSGGYGSQGGGYGSQSRQSSWQQGPHSGRGPQGYQRSNERISEEVCEALTRHGHIDASGIQVRVENGEVTLEGTVGSRREKRLAEDILEDVSGVRDVHNHLRVQKEEGSGRGGLLGNLFGGGSSAESTGATGGANTGSSTSGMTVSGTSGLKTAGSSGTTGTESRNRKK